MPIMILTQTLNESLRINMMIHACITIYLFNNGIDYNS